MIHFNPSPKIKARALELATGIVEKPRIGRDYTPAGDRVTVVKFKRTTDSEVFRKLEAVKLLPDVVFCGADPVCDTAFIGRIE